MLIIGFNLTFQLGASSKSNEFPLSSILPGLAGSEVGGSHQASSKVVEAHLAVQAAIRSYQVTETDGESFFLFFYF